MKKTTDARGNTLDEMMERAQRDARLHGKTIMVGRIYTSARRWFWGKRFDMEARTLDDGSRWEPVQAVEPQ